jgi:iron complex outermembrane receptor protein
LGTSPLIVNGQVIGNLYANTGANDPVTGKLLGNAVQFNAHNETRWPPLVRSVQHRRVSA